MQLWSGSAIDWHGISRHWSVCQQIFFGESPSLYSEPDDLVSGLESTGLKLPSAMVGGSPPTRYTENRGNFRAWLRVFGW